MREQGDRTDGSASRAVLGRVWRGWWGRSLRAAAALSLLTAAAGATTLPEPAPAAEVLKVRLGGDARTTRVVVELAGPVRGRVAGEDAPGDQVDISLQGASAAGDMAGAGAGLVRRWAVDERTGAARLRLDLARPATVRRRFLLPPADGLSVYRYVVDLESADATPASPMRSARQEAPIEPLTPMRKVVVIDAGHGGKDPGAHGADAREKALTLLAARSLRDRLERSGRYRVVLTRDTDVFVPLSERVRIARRANADLFISLHADAGSEPELRGATVYTMSEHGADRSSGAAFGRGPNWFDVEMPGRDATVNRILFDLTQRDTRNRSSEFAEVLLDDIGESVPLLRRSHRDAGYMVLLAPDVPAVLLEMGFITNAFDERRLSDAGERRRFMSAVGDAIDAYFAQDRRIALR